MSLRRRLADSRRLNRWVEGLIAGYLRFAFATSRWERTGFEAMEAELAKGEPVIFCVWHQRLILSPWMFDTRLGKFCSLTSSARAGRLVGQVLGRFGFDTVPMSSHKRHVALSREVLRRIGDGYTIGIAVDGPRGPARVASTVPLVWARSTGKRIFVLSWSARRRIRAWSWDRFLLPLPFSRGVMMCRAFSGEVPRGLDVDQTEELRLRLQRALDDVTDASDMAAGRRRERG
ncbi:MAG: DUF374 domain-containing protein [Pseudooceanicola sp.]|nr:DUF374 domain-containing protein [Pseudooceanicola sp.]